MHPAPAVRATLAKRLVLPDSRPPTTTIQSTRAARSMGYVAEGSGENLFIVKNGIIKTPPLTNALAGITRDSLITVAKDLGYDVVEQYFTRDDVYVADEVFFSGTAAEVTPIREVDHRVIGEGHGLAPGICPGQSRATPGGAGVRAFYVKRAGTSLCA